MTYKQLTASALISHLALVAACNARLHVEDPVIELNPDAGVIVTVHSDAGANSSDAPPPRPNCDDQFENGDETDVDCGGSCPACPVDASCNGHPDCESGSCRAGNCQPATCGDGTMNGDEAGVDCGGQCESSGRSCSVDTVPCDCAGSESLRGIACGPALATYNVRSYLTPNGESFLFHSLDRSNYLWSSATGVAKLETGISEPAGLSIDGSTMLFHAEFGEYEPPFLLTASGTRTDLEEAADALALSEDGNIVLIGAGTLASFGARWSPSGLEPITDGDPIFYFAPSFMTPDGSKVGGRRRDDTYATQLFSWTGGSAVQALGVLPGWAAATVNNGVAFSRDGTVIAGFMADTPSAQPDHTNQIFRWNEASGITVIAPLWPGGAVGDPVTDQRLWMNDDGSVLVGTFDLNAETRAPEPSAFRWTEATGPLAIAATPGQRSVLRDASRDASVAVGYTLEDERPFVWNAAAGLRELSAVLTAAAVDQSGWVLSKPAALSADGRVVVGEGLCSGVPAVYRAVLPD